MTFEVLKESQARVDHILDVTRDLMLRWGHDRVTVGEIARHAAVGKGTVYLHWSTKEELFRDAVARECAAAVRQCLASARTDSHDLRLSRLSRLLFQLAMRHPLYRALNLRDSEVLGRMAGPSAYDLGHLRLSVLLSAPDYLQCLSRGQALRAVPGAGDINQLVAAVIEGFLAPAVSCRHDAGGVAVASRAHQLEWVLRQAFEPVEGPSGFVAADVDQAVRGYLTDVARQCVAGSYPGPQ